MGWEEVAAKLPTKKSDDQKEARRTLFDSFDPNGNGYLSLAECDKGITDCLGLTADVLPKPVLMRAFQAAKNVAQQHGKNPTQQGNDYIERNEFRIFLVYLSHYLELWYMFDTIDENNDRRVTFAEFEKAVPKLVEWGVAMDDPKAQFDKIDTNGGGMILFDEFSKWAGEEAIGKEEAGDV